MADFKIAYNITREHEGGYVNHALDRGGETYKGIARRMHPNWQGWTIIDMLRHRPGFPSSLYAHKSLDDLVLEFYKENFWDKIRLGEIKYQYIANELFDTAVNMGTGIAIEFLQKSLNILNKNGRDYKNTAVDRVIGAETLRLTNNHPYPQRLFNALNAYQAKRYIEICERDSSQEVFFAGWLTRIDLMK